jgi:hypothetical protein
MNKVLRFIIAFLILTTSFSFASGPPGSAPQPPGFSWQTPVVGDDGYCWSIDWATKTLVPAACSGSGEATTFEVLDANGDVGTGAAQVAAGNHNHSGVYVESESDPAAGAVTGVIKSDGSNNFSAADADDLSDGTTNAIPTLTQEGNWDTAYGWGDHGSAGYESHTSNDIDPDRLNGDTTDDNLVDGGILGECSNSKGALPTTNGITDGYVPKKQTDGSVSWEADSTGAGGDQLVDIVTTSPLTVNAGANVNDALPGSDADITFAIADAAADGSTKGAASFATNDFDSSSGNISIDYTNGQVASSGAKGFLTSADWSTFNGKQDALTNPLTQSDVDDTPDDGDTTTPPSANWAYDHENAADPHAGYMLESNIGFGANNYLKLAASPGTPDTTKFLRDDGTWVVPSVTVTDLDDLPGDTVDDDLIDQEIIAGMTSTGSASPGFTAYDSDSPGSDKTAGFMGWQYVDGADGSENSDWLLQIMQGGSLVTILAFDESDDQWETSKVINSSGGFTGALTGTASGNLVAADVDTWAEHPVLPENQILVGNNSNQPAAVAMSGDATMANDGTLTIANNAVEPGMISTMNAYSNIPVGWMKDGTSPPDALDDGTTRSPYAYRTFASDADEDLNFVWFVPSDLSGSVIQFRVKYLITNVTGPSSEGVAFGLSGVSLGDNDPTNGSKGTVVVVTDPTITADQHDILITGWSGDVTITNLAAGELAEIALIRDVSDAADDYGQVVGVIAVEIRYVKDPA